ncbi:hypothetical protein B0H13DRAFT_2233058 [Mycena leptocephala]|nr:hypothetical protein B0H13DRAFT_2233058 [Mycena leptocephala]
MSDLYTSFYVSPRKKRCPPERDDDTTTPKKLRIVRFKAPSHRITSSRKAVESRTPSCHPTCRGFTPFIRHCSTPSHALATCAISPTSDTGIVRNVLNNLSLSTYSGLSTQFEVDDLRRLCWIWEWDGVARGKASPKDWTRGAMGIILSPATHHSRVDGKRVPAYGIGIEIDMDIDKDMPGGMAAVARWTTAGKALHTGVTPIPTIPCADLPRLSASTKTTSLTHNLASLSPKSSISPFKLPAPPSSPSRSPSKPKTAAHLCSTACTPVRQRGAAAEAVPKTPSSSRREALYERLRQRSLSASPTKAASSEVKGGKLTRDQLLKMGQDKLRRRCLLGRLGGVAESVWMLFYTPAPGSTASTSVHKRRALPMSKVVAAIVKSSPVPISSAEAVDSLVMLAKLCPFFLKQLTIGGEKWLEMPAPSAGSTEGSPSKKPLAPGSPGAVIDSAEALVTRSPPRVNREAGGLREVREIIRRELRE